MDSRWQKVYDTNLKYRAEIVKAVLADHEISAVLVDKQDTAYHFGHIEVYVAPHDVLSAVKIIQDVISFR
jgi:type III secretory pathway lipoprotein EscJ